MRLDPRRATDAELLRAARRDGAPFRELYERHAEAVYGFVLRRTRDPDAAHDLTAETFAQAWLCRRRFRDDAGGSAAPWLHGIARNLVVQSVRRRGIELAACARLGVLERLDRPPTVTEPDERWLEGLDEALAELPDAQRTALELRVVHDLDYDRVAAELDTTPGAARVRVARGLEGLRQRLATRAKEAL
jgi:RNA polymerase sigma factor (sigma-70 family)